MDFTLENFIKHRCALTETGRKFKYITTFDDVGDNNKVIKMLIVREVGSPGYEVRYLNGRKLVNFVDLDRDLVEVVDPNVELSLVVGVPKPETKLPENRKRYFSLSNDGLLVTSKIWKGDEQDLANFAHGLVWLDENSAKSVIKTTISKMLKELAVYASKNQ